MNPLNTVKIKDGESYRIINESDFKHGLHELCEGEKLSAQPSVVSGSSAGSTKADLEKLQTENTDLISDLKTALDAKDQLQAKLTEIEGQLIAVQAENTDLKAKITAPTKKPTAAELKAAKAAEEAKAAEQPQE